MRQMSTSCCNERHLFGKCTTLIHLYNKYKIKNYVEVFNSRWKTDWLREIVKFVKETKIERLNKV